MNDPIIAGTAIFLLTAVIGWRLFSDLASADTNLRLALPVALSGVVLIGTIIVAASSGGWFGRITGILACALAGGSAVGGSLIVRSLLQGHADDKPSV